MNEQQRQEILYKLDKKIKEIEKNDKKVQNLDIEEVTLTLRLLYK